MILYTVKNSYNGDFEYGKNNFCCFKTIADNSMK